MTNKKENKEIVAVENKNELSVQTLISQAIEQKLPVETMRDFFSLAKEVKAENARASFVKALADFQAECPIIKKTKPVYNKDGKTVRYKYAPMDSVIEQIKKPLANAQLSYAWDVEHTNDHMKVICKLTHVDGHHETSTFEIPIVKSDFMTSPQSYATAQTYAKRYTLLNVLGIGTAEEDTDSNDTGHDKDAKSIKSKIMLRLRELNEKTKTKKEIEEAVKKLTNLDLVEKNYEDIAARLQAIINESHENAQV